MGVFAVCRGMRSELTPFYQVIVGMHRPWYVSVSPPTWPAWQEAFEKIMYDNEVDVYTQGHVHVYERWVPRQYSIYTQTDESCAAALRRCTTARSTRRG